MIEKLKKKVSLIITLSISIILIGIILIFAILNYNNTIDVAVSTFDRFNDFSKIKNIPQDQMDINENSIEIEWENTYSFIIDNGQIIDSPRESNDKIDSYAIKVANKKNGKGIIGNYVYRARNTKDGKIVIMLIKDDNVINRIRIICVFTVLGMVVSIIVTYIISKKISSIIVKPVEETVERQKQFISDASHELKTPLAVIEANVDVLESQVGKSKWMDYIQCEISSMDKLINNLLFLAKVENVKELKTKETFNLSEEVKMINSMFESMAYEKKITLKSNVQENIIVNGNKEDIKQVLSVLIENAIMHTKEKGETIIELIKEKNNVIIQVKNEGEAIPEEEQEKIFERFYRIDKSRNRKEKRYGLGLAIAKSIVEQYKGKIEVDCKDGITIFKVTI